MERIDIAKAIVNKNLIQDYRVACDSPFEGLLIGCTWDLKDEIRDTIKEALEQYITRLTKGGKS